MATTQTTDHKPHHARMYAWAGDGKLINGAACQYDTIDDASEAAHAVLDDHTSPAASVVVEAWMDEGGDEVRQIESWCWMDVTGEWRRD